jgi:PAS fold
MARQANSSELLESERFLNEFFNNSNVGLATFDQQLRYRALNPCLAASHRTPAENHLGKHLQEILGDVASQVEPFIQQVFKTGSCVFNCEIVGALPTRPDAGHWISNFFPITDSNGKVVQVGAVVVELGKDVQLQRTQNPSMSAVTLLRSWKDIARYVGTCVKTVQRWEEAYQFPIRRIQPNKKGAVVFALRNEVDHWLLSRAASTLGRKDSDR